MQDKYYGPIKFSDFVQTFPCFNRHAEGNYTCTANNGIGNPDIKAMFLSVQCKPEIDTDKVIITSIQ